jgi:hypothetical protein
VAQDQPGQKKFVRLYLNTKNLGVVVYAYHPSDVGEPELGGPWLRPAWEKARPYLQNNQSKKTWRYGSRSTVPA